MLGAFAGVAGAQEASCRTDTLTVGFPKAWIGARVGQVGIDASTLEAPAGTIGNAMRALHVRTQLWVPLGEMSVTPGTPLDSIDLQESARRLRLTGLYTDVVITGVRCGEEPVTLTVHTRDAWSLRTDLRYGRTSSRVSLSERNLGGQALSVSLAAENIDNLNAVTVGVTQPYLFGTRFRASAQMRAYSDGRAWAWSLRSREFSPRDAWRFSVLSDQLRRYRDDGPHEMLTDINRRTDAATAAYRFALDDHRAYAVVFGGEHEEAEIVVRRPGATLGKPEVTREFTAPLLGITRRSLDVSSIDWLVPGQPPAELPVGFQGEIVVGVGGEQYTHRQIVHLDGWMGLTLKPTSGTIFTSDIWVSGYENSDSLMNGDVRMSAVVYQRARRGIWALRFASERLIDPDPDVYALQTFDPVLRSLAPATRLAESAITASLERSVTMYSREGRWAVDAVPFVQFSERHRSVDITLASPTNPQALLLGIGIRHLFNQPTQSPVRFDIAKTVWLSGGLPNRWVFVLSMQSWLASGRNRDGLREIVR
jgi:hypothetical protein